jgi:NADH-quinone oxidoreductase subunit K
MSVSIHIPLLLSAFLFSIGLILILSRKNIIIVLIGIELLFNACNLNFVTFSQFDQDANGIAFSLFIIVIAAAEISVALAIILLLHQRHRNIELDSYNDLNG